MNMKVQGLYMSWTGFRLTVDRAVADSHTNICAGFNS